MPYHMTTSGHFIAHFPLLVPSHAVLDHLMNGLVTLDSYYRFVSGEHKGDRKWHFKTLHRIISTCSCYICMIVSWAIKEEKSTLRNDIIISMIVLCPHSAAIHIACVTRDHKVPSSNHMWVAAWRGGVQICLWLRAPKRPIGVCRKK